MLHIPRNNNVVAMMIRATFINNIDVGSRNEWFL